MGKPLSDDDEEDDLLPELSDELGADDGALGLEDEDTLGEIEDAPEEVGLDVETLEGEVTLDGALDDEDDDAPSVLDDDLLELEGELDGDEDEDGWAAESEGSPGAFEDDLLDSDDEELEDDGGLEGVDDPTLDDFAEEQETSIDMDGDDQEGVEELERVELDL